jgi:hypothetical protein
MLALAATAKIPASTRFVGSPPDAGRTLGKLSVRYQNLEEGGTFTTHYQLVAGGLVGASEGYSTLRAAMRAMTEPTKVNAPAAAIIERDGRYYGHVLKSRDLEYGIHSRVEPLFFEEDSMSRIADIRATARMERLHAIVDGDFAHRFRR